MSFCPHQCCWRYAEHTALGRQYTANESYLHPNHNSDSFKTQTFKFKSLNTVLDIIIVDVQTFIVGYMNEIYKILI